MTILHLLLVSPLLAGPQAQPVEHFDFEQDALGALPQGWLVPSAMAVRYGAEVVGEDPYRGQQCVRIFLQDVAAEAPFGNLLRRIDATPFRGKRVQFEVALRAAVGARVQAWMRVDRANEAVGFFDNMSDRPVMGAEWSLCEIGGRVEEDAETINYGVILTEGSEGFLDAVSLSLVALPELPPPRPLSERGLTNLRALAELYGYVRYFHPSDEAEKANWSEMALAGVEAVESAEDDSELAAALTTLFDPVAPSVRVFAAGMEPRPTPELEAPPEGNRVYLRQWLHNGLGSSDSPRPTGYSSTRQRKHLVSRGVPEGFIDPADVYRAELPGGVSCTVPLALYEADGKTLPVAVASMSKRAEAAVSGGDDRTTRLAGVLIAWNVFQHFYPYFDVTEVDWPAELERALRAAATDADGRAFLSTLRRMVAALGDGHGNVYHVSVAGFGVLPFAMDWIEGRLLVTHVPPQAQLDLAAGDAILAIDGGPVEELMREAEALVSGATPQWIRYRAIGELSTGTDLTPRSLTIEPFAGGGRRSLEVRPTAEPAGSAEPRPEPLVELEPGLWYVDVSRVNDKTFDAAVEDLAAANGIVWDFRGYPGELGRSFLSHLAREPLTSPQWLVPVVTRPNREGMTFRRSGEWRLRPKEPRFESQQVFLIDGRAISYAESCLGIIENYHLGELVGGPTAGTNGNVNSFTLPGNYHVTWTGMKVLKHDGSRHHGVGILPTVPVERTRAGVAAGRDELLERGLALLRGGGH